MLRYGYLPSDFHPLVLMLGDREDLRLLADVLAAHGSGAGPVAFPALDFVAPSPTPLLLVSEGGPGLVVEGGAARWQVPPADALRFAQQVERLTGAVAGREVLEFGHPDEIKVMVSIGEFSDDVLPR